MNRDEILAKTVTFVKEELAAAEGAHDWWHIYRVWKLAKHIAKDEHVDMLIVELAALLHDVADSKLHGGDEELGPMKVQDFLCTLPLDKGIVEHVEQIVSNISFRLSLKTSPKEKMSRSAELNVVQDADRLDAIGAIGIARTFNFGGHKGNALYDPALKPRVGMSFEEYKTDSAPTINHFYEKLLLLKDRMNTKTGKRLAEQRHKFMEHYLEQFYKEWEGEA